MEAFPTGAKVDLIYPTGQKGSKGTVEYKSKVDLVDKLETLACRNECDDVVFMFVGSGKKDLDKKRIGFPIGKKVEPLWGEDLGKVILSCEKSFKLYMDFCFSESFLDQVKKNEKDYKEKSWKRTKVAVSSSKKDETALRSLPLLKKGHTIFSRYFLQDYYLIITDPNVLRKAFDKAKRARKHLMVILISEAFKSASVKTVEQSDNTQHPVAKKAVMNNNGIKYPEKPLICVKDTIDERAFHFYKVEEKSRKGNADDKCRVVGFVSDYDGNPIAPITHVRCKMDCSLTKFKYTEPGDANPMEKKVSIQRDNTGEYTMEINGNKREIEFPFMPLEQFFDGNEIAFGEVSIKILPGYEFEAKIRWYEDVPDPNDPAKTRRIAKVVQGVNISYSKRKVLTIDFFIKGRKKTVEVKFVRQKKTRIRVSGTKAFKSNQVVASNIIDSDGDPIGDLVFQTQKDYTINGEVHIHKTGNKIPISGSFNSEDSTFFASGGGFEFQRTIDAESGVMKTTWRNVVANMEGLVQSSYDSLIPTPLVNSTSTSQCSQSSQDVKLEWMSSQEEIFLQARSDGSKIVRYSALTDEEDVFAVAAGINTFEDSNLDPSDIYTYRLYSFVFPDVAFCLLERPGPYYSNPIYVDAECDHRGLLTQRPSDSPSVGPSEQLSGDPSASSSVGPSDMPSGGPSVSPSLDSSELPSGGSPSEGPSEPPSGDPSASSSVGPSNPPSGGSSVPPSLNSSELSSGGSPSEGPSEPHSKGPSASSSVGPSEPPSEGPSNITSSVRSSRP